MFLHGENVGKQWTSQYRVDYGRMYVNVGYLWNFSKVTVDCTRHGIGTTTIRPVKNQ
jgi:hypothetical protein